MLHCYNRGCGQQFDPEKNTEESCRHHPGAPFFHDAYKGWSCCNKKSVDFTEFLNIRGCTLGKHSNVKPPEAEKPVKDDKIDKNEVIEVRAPIREALPRPPLDTPMTTIQSEVAPALKQTIDELKTNNTKVVKPNTTAETGISIGTSCKNNGCTYSYAGTSQDLEECIYHPGVPIFHEGLKFWSCCQKRTTDFNQFMAQKGCASGQHKWIKDNDKKIVECRYDWHQTAMNVIVSIYAKKYDYSESRIEISPVRLRVTLVFPEQDNAKFALDLELRGMVNVEKTTAQMFGTKVEITLPKLEPGSWQKLSFPKTTLPTTTRVPTQSKPEETQSDASEDEFFDLDDIETLKSQGMSLSELKSNDLD